MPTYDACYSLSLSVKVTATKQRSTREITFSFLEQVGVTTGNVTVINPGDWPTFTWEPARPVTTPAPPRLVRQNVIMHSYAREYRVAQHYLENGSNHIFPVCDKPYHKIKENTPLGEELEYFWNYP